MSQPLHHDRGRAASGELRVHGFFSSDHLERSKGGTRGREGEDMINIEYLSKLQFVHQTMLEYFTRETHVVDALRSAEHVARGVKDILKAYYFDTPT